MWIFQIDFPSSLERSDCGNTVGERRRLYQFGSRGWRLNGKGDRRASGNDDQRELVGLVTFGDWLVVGLTMAGEPEGYAGPSPTA
jgi:hypothetical protein